MKNTYFQNLINTIYKYIKIGYENFMQYEDFNKSGNFEKIDTFEYMVQNVFYQKSPKRNNIKQEYIIWLRISKTSLLQNINIYNENELIKIITKELRFCSKYLDYAESMEFPIGVYQNKELILIFKKIN